MTVPPRAPNDEPPGSEREQTDESLRIEREKADQANVEEAAAVDETADAVISRARTVADDVLAATRAKTDQAAPRGRPPETITRERAVEDRVLREERSSADEALRDEHAEHTARRSREREETDKDLTNERARSDNALATRDELLGTVSHEMRNSLNAVIGFAGLIAKEASNGKDLEKVLMHARLLLRSGARMNRLIGDLVDIASIDAGVLKVMYEIGDPAHIVAEAVETVQAQASAGGVSLVTQVVSPSTLIHLDPARVLQVLTNLLSNAIKFTPADGTVVVRVERIDDDIRFAVIDTGVGIPADKLEAVFLRFVQVTASDRRGAGLGLFISKCIVEGHGGRIWAESTNSQGSTFYFTLPVHVAS